MFHKELLNGMVIPDAAKMTRIKCKEYYEKMKTVITETVPDEQMREKMVGELDKFMTNLMEEEISETLLKLRTK